VRNRLVAARRSAPGGDPSYIAKTIRKPRMVLRREYWKGVDLLAAHPHIGRAGRVIGTRNWWFPARPYVVPYRVKEDRLELIAVFHGKQKCLTPLGPARPSRYIQSSALLSSPAGSFLSKPFSWSKADRAGFWKRLSPVSARPGQRCPDRPGHLLFQPAAGFHPRPRASTASATIAAARSPQTLPRTRPEPLFLAGDHLAPKSPS